MKKLAEMTDEELALCYMDGNNHAFDVLLSRTQSKLFSYILLIVRDQDTANDIFQDTYVKIIIKLQRHLYTPTGKFTGWCIRIAHNVIMDWYRDQKSSRIVEPAEGNDLSRISNNDVMEQNIENKFVNKQVMTDVKRLLDKLPAPQREVVFMRFYQQLSFKEIAEITDVSINTALGRMRYAVLNMRRMAKSHHLQLQMEA